MYYMGRRSFQYSLDMLREELLKVLQRYVSHFKINRVWCEDNRLVIDFVDRKINVLGFEGELPTSYYASSIAVEYSNGKYHVDVTVRVYVRDYKELYMDYVYNRENIICRPHVSMEDKILSIQCRFTTITISEVKEIVHEILNDMIIS